MSVDCCICLLNLNEDVVIKLKFCNHEFHIACIAKWFFKNVNCPYCRSNFALSDLLRLKFFNSRKYLNPLDNNDFFEYLLDNIDKLKSNPETATYFRDLKGFYEGIASIYMKTIFEKNTRNIHNLKYMKEFVMYFKSVNDRLDEFLVTNDPSKLRYWFHRRGIRL